MNFSILIVQPPNYVHSAAFNELAELIAHGLTDLGHRVIITVNEIRAGYRQILIGCHLLDAQQILDMPSDTIILNTEQVRGTFDEWNATILEWIRHFEVWDYSPRNIEAMSGRTTKPVRLLRIGHHPALERIVSAQEQDIDILFYGSRNDRRQQILDQLTAAGVAVKSVFGVYGAERDALIARSKIVLNMHYFPTQIFEVVRVFYLLTNRKAVVSEVNADTAIDPVYCKGVAAASYVELADTCFRLLADDGERRALEARGFAAIASMPQAALLSELISG